MIRLTTIARTGRRMKMSVSFMALSAVLRLRGQLRVELDGVVDRDRRAVAQLERARGHDLFSVLDAVEDGDEIAARLADADELLARDLARLAVGAGHDRAALVLAVLDDEDRVA